MLELRIVKLEQIELIPESWAWSFATEKREAINRHFAQLKKHVLACGMGALCCFIATQYKAAHSAACALKPTMRASWRGATGSSWTAASIISLRSQR